LRRPHWLTAACAAAFLLLAPGVVTRAAAQSASPRVVLGVSGGAQSSSSALSDHFEFERNVETATVDVKYPAKVATLFDAGIGVRLFKALGAGVAVSNATRDGNAEVDARIPHPLLFAQLRTVEGSQPGISRTETAVHVQLLYTIAASPKIAVVLAVGPSIVHLEQELVTDVTYDEAYPFDAATFKSAPAHRAKASATGFNAGADVRWMFARSIGIGALVRFSRATVDLSTEDKRTLAVRAGGVQAGVGIRIAF
jgi:hypothetical protein